MEHFCFTLRSIHSLVKCPIVKECKAPGMYGMACKRGKGCLLLRQARDEAASAQTDAPDWMKYEKQGYP